jgi:hypothetical protein
LAITHPTLPTQTNIQDAAVYKEIQEFVDFAKGKADKHDLKDLEEVIALLPLRGKALSEAAHRLKPFEKQLTDDQLFSLASTDLFVEKAQLVLTRRSNSLARFGAVTIICTFLILVLAASFIGVQLRAPLDERIVASVNALLLRIFQATAFSAFVLVGVKYLIALGRSFFHEAISLRERRHALRFGRLYVYLKKGKIDLEALEQAFQWNKESKTSFLDMKPEVVAETLLHKLIESIAKVPPETVKVILRTAEQAKNVETIANKPK